MGCYGIQPHHFLPSEHRSRCNFWWGNSRKDKLLGQRASWSNKTSKQRIGVSRWETGRMGSKEGERVEVLMRCLGFLTVDDDVAVIQDTGPIS